METSLTVPTATSVRRVPIKVLDENRRIINKHLSESGGGKASYTHLIAWALLCALREFPQLNDGYEERDGQSVRLKREAINLGVAIDLAKGWLALTARSEHQEREPHELSRIPRGL
jgi:2-oxoglutarate dehydrogenase E1 component